jgi:hypothetical protein
LKALHPLRDRRGRHRQHAEHDPHLGERGPDRFTVVIVAVHFGDIEVARELRDSAASTVALGNKPYLRKVRRACQCYSESVLSLPDVTLRRRRYAVAFGGLLWFCVAFYCALTGVHVGLWAASALFAAFAAAGHDRLSRMLPVEKRGKLDVDRSGLWFRGVRLRRASAFYGGRVAGPIVYLRGHLPFGDLEIDAQDAADAERILSALDVLDLRGARAPRTSSSDDHAQPG